VRPNEQRTNEEHNNNKKRKWSLCARHVHTLTILCLCDSLASNSAINFLFLSLSLLYWLFASRGVHIRTFQFSLLRSEARRTKKRKLHKCQSFCLLQYDCGMWLVLFFDQIYFSHIFLIGQKANMSSFCERHDLFSYTSLYSPRSYIRFLNSTLILLAFASQSC